MCCTLSLISRDAVIFFLLAEGDSFSEEEEEAAFPTSALCGQYGDSEDLRLQHT